MTHRKTQTATNISFTIWMTVLFMGIFTLTFLVQTQNAHCQEIMLDRMIKCGDLACFPTYDDPNTYYYLPDQPRVAKKNGRPQFSFLKYARVKETGKAGINEAEGGGIVHFLIEYGATPGRVAKAQAALKAKNKKAKIAGPIMFRKARFALVTQFTQDNREFTKIATIGKAPLLEGQKAAVSIGLTREGAEVLWESFKTSTPDISIVIEADFDGIKEPYEATMTVDWEKVSKNHRIGVGGKYKWFGADVDILLRELRKEGAITLVVKGKDTNMDRAWMDAQGILIHKMFEEIPIDQDVRKEILKGKYPNLQKAMSLSRKQACLEPAPGLPGTIHLNRYPELMAALKALAAQVLGISEARAYTFREVTESEGNARKKQQYDECSRLLNQARLGKYDTKLCTEALDCFMSMTKQGDLGEAREKKIKKAIRLLKKKLATSMTKKDVLSGPETGKSREPTSIGDVAKMAASETGILSGGTAGKGNTGASAHETPHKRDSDKKKKKKRHGHRGSSHSPDSKKHRGGKGRSKQGGGNINKGSGIPGPVGLLVSYRMRQIKRTGKFRLDMKRYSSQTRHFVMSENIGDLYSRYGQDPRIFRAVLIDDPVYKQREILITLDGQDAATFRKHVNFVTVQMRKVHESGDITRDEIVITPETFNTKANLYEFVYGYKGDHDRDAWLQYQARDIWSFAGGIVVEHDWTGHNEAILSVKSPVSYRTVSIEGDGGRLSAANVRHGVIEIFTIIDDRELKEEISIRNSGPAPMKTVEVPVWQENPPEYRITWYLNDGSRIEGARQKLQGDILYWDIMAEGGNQ